MTLYKGENVEDVVRYLETDEYLYWARKRLDDNYDSMRVRAMFSVLDDDGYRCPNDDLCYCHWYPKMPLASTTWTVENERAWLEEETLPEVPHETITQYFRDNEARRSKGEVRA